MKEKHLHRGVSGFTVIEIMISLFIFGLLMAMLYPTFDSVSNRVSEQDAKQALMQKGQRVMDYMGEEFRLAGLFIGSNPSLMYCGEATATDSIVHADAVPCDTVTILTSERITTTMDGIPYLSTFSQSLQGNNVITVNVPASSYVSAITPATGTAGNAGAFITFDTLKPNIGALVYQVTQFAGSHLTIMRNNDPSLGLEQAVNRSSNAYSVVRKRFAVTASRSLQVQQWNSDCSLNPEDLVSSWGPGNNNGGVDGFEVEYTVWDPVSNSIGTRTVINAGDVVNVRAVMVWLLLRSDFPTKEYKNNDTYSLGAVTAGPFNDAYKRELMTKTVEVRNVRL